VDVWGFDLLLQWLPFSVLFTALLLRLHPIAEVLFIVCRRRMRNEHPGRPDRLHFHSLVKRCVTQRLLPNSIKSVHNSVGGLLVGARPILPAVVVQFVHTSTAAAVAVSLLLMFGYEAMYKQMMAKVGR
jgi:hypothetical protein